MKRTPFRRRAKLHDRQPLQRLRRWWPRTRSALRSPGRCCIVCRTDRRIDPAQLIPRSLGGCGDALCVVPACRRCHRANDRGELDLLPYLEPGWRTQLAHAVGHVGLIGALRRITGHRTSSDENGGA